jgi:hypothetical protein
MNRRQEERLADLNTAYQNEVRNIMEEDTIREVEPMEMAMESPTPIDPEEESIGYRISPYNLTIEQVNNGFIVRGNNRLIIDTNKFSSLVFSNTLNYDLEVGKNHRITTLLGYEYIRNDFDTFVAQADDFPFETEDFFVLNAATGARTSRGTSTANTTLSQFGKINYAYSNRYLASFTLRRDGSSRFGENTRFGIFPATTVGWRISNEDFFKINDIMCFESFNNGWICNFG